MSENTFFLEPVPPFRLDLTVWALRRHPDNAVDRWDGKAFRRIVMLEGQTVELAVKQVSAPEAPRLCVKVRGASLDSELKEATTRVLERLLGLQIDLRDWYRLASHDSELGPLVRELQGMKPPRLPTVFESVVSAIACQQTTLTDGIRLLNRLTEYCGHAITKRGRAHAFPRAEDLVGFASTDPYLSAVGGPYAINLLPKALREMGFKPHKACSIVEVASRIVDGKLDLEGITTLTNEEARARLVKLPGVNLWAAQSVLLRGLGRLDVFPADDVDARNSLQRLLGLSKPIGHADVGHIRPPWKPFAGLIYFHLLLRPAASTSSS
jgi:DNA-3-methyladenine glycosylase II